MYDASLTQIPVYVQRHIYCPSPLRKYRLLIFYLIKVVLSTNHEGVRCTDTDNRPNADRFQTTAAADLISSILQVGDNKGAGSRSGATDKTFSAASGTI